MIDAVLLATSLDGPSRLTVVGAQAIAGGLPDSLYDVLVLAGLLTTAITSISAMLSAIFVKRDNLLYLGTQLLLMSVFLLLSMHWSRELWFAAIFGDEGEMSRFGQTMLFAAIAYTIDMAMKHVVWAGLFRRNGRRSVPPLLVGAVRVFIYLFTFLLVIQFVYDKSITALAALSGAFALVLGLSAQSTLGEMFAGIAIALSHPFRIGDWVKIGALDEGHVVDMTWRMVRIETRDRVMLNVPNRQVADQPVRNFSYPNRAVRLSEAIFFPQTADPRLVQELLLEAIAGTPHTVRDPAPSVLYRGAKDSVAEYSMRYYIDDYQKKDIATELVWKRVLDHCERSPIKIVFPRRVVEVLAEPVDAAAAFAGEAADLR